jgi:glycosyltransferase involved in cell wall biosynthesis
VKAISSKEAVAPTVGVVVIGRNEGDRLRRCLDSVIPMASRVVYVDSGSTDDSVAMATAKGVEVVRLQMQRPFTAARARNAGLAQLLAESPDLTFVQFVDGDCEVIDGWLGAAQTFLVSRPDVACVCGRLRERFPEVSIYNRLCDAEWDRPVGQTDACGGIAMMRCAVLQQLGGFREDMVAGEEPELCSRMWNAGCKVWRLADPMAWHDADMRHFKQWWMRSRRTGFYWAQSSTIEGHISRKLFRKRLVGSVLWAAVVPAVALAGALWWWPATLVLALYPLQLVRIARSLGGPDRWSRAYFLLLGKFPELLGQIQFWRLMRHARPHASFDYK